MANQEKSNWKKVTVTELLGLTPEEEMIVEFKVTLSKMLRRARESNKITQKDLAIQIGSSQPRVSMMESADETVSIDLLISTLFSMGVTPSEIGYELIN